MRPFEKLGWESILQLNTPYYPKLVREFYANIELKGEVNLRNIVSYVKNVPIKLTEKVLYEVLGMDTSPREYFCYGIDDDLNYRQDDAVERVKIEKRERCRDAM